MIFYGFVMKTVKKPPPLSIINKKYMKRKFLPKPTKEEQTAVAIDIVLAFICLATGLGLVLYPWVTR